MTKFFAVLSLLAVGYAGANELDQDVVNQGLQGTVVIRVDQRDNSVSFLQINSAIENETQAVALNQGTFQPVPAAHLKKELDNEAGASSWYYFYAPYGYAYNNCLNWGGYSYNPYYVYNQGYYNYSYYGYNYGYNYGPHYGYNRGFYGGRGHWGHRR